MSMFAGIVLAAGFGTRLKPFTDRLPKPLVTLLDKTPLWHQIVLLQSAGIKRIYVNLHYKYKQIREYLLREFPSVEYIYEPTILGTGGGIKNIINYFNVKGPVVVLNGDTVSNFDINKTIKHFKTNNFDALMILKRDNEVSDEAAVFVDRNNLVKFIKETPPSGSNLKRCRFLGAHILSPTSYRFLPQNGCINKVMYPALISNNKKIGGFITKRDSPDIGSPQSLYNTNFCFINGVYYTNVFSKRYIAKGKDNNGNIIGNNCRISNSILHNCIIGEHSSIENSVISDSVVLPFSKIIHKRLKRCVANTKYHYIIHPRRRLQL